MASEPTKKIKDYVPKWVWRLLRQIIREAVEDLATDLKNKYLPDFDFKD